MAKEALPLLRGTKIAANREEWLEIRKGGLGASDAAAALGISPWKSRYELWAEKTGLIEGPDLSDNEAVEAGTRLEKPIALWYGDRSGRKVAFPEMWEISIDPECPYLRCTLDAVQFQTDRPDPGNLQIKTTGAHHLPEWEADGPPLHYLVQVQHEMMVSGLQWTTIATLFGGQKLRWYDIPRNDRLIERMRSQLIEFWGRVQSNVPPPADGTESCSRALAKLYPSMVEGEIVELAPDAMAWDEELQTLKDTIKAANSRKRELENLIKATIGSAEQGILPDGTIYSWREQTRDGYTVEPSTFRVLRRRAAK